MKKGPVSACLLLLLAAPATLPQEKPDPEIPPDLTHVSKIGCHLNAHATGLFVLDAKSGKEKEVKYWEVIPYVTYDTLPGGTRREDWVMSPSLVRTEDGMRLVSTAGDRCQVWMDKVQDAQIAEHHKMGHTLKGETKP